MNIFGAGLLEIGIGINFEPHITLNFNYSGSKEPTLKFCINEMQKGILDAKTYRIKNLLKTLNKWYCLPESQDFTVSVFNSKTGEHNETFARAVKMFLQDVKRPTALSGLVWQYVNSEKVKDFIMENNLYKKDYDLQINYAKLYYCLCVIVNIFTPRSTNEDSKKITAKVFYPSNDFHFVADLDKEELKAYCQRKGTDYSSFISSYFSESVLILGNEILLENIVPDFYLHLGSQDAKTIGDNADIRHLENYHVTFNC